MKLPTVAKFDGFNLTTTLFPHFYISVSHQTLSLTFKIILYLNYLFIKSSLIERGH